jgi:hypothetical protein
LLPPNTGYPSSPPPRPKPRYNPRLTHNPGSPFKVTPQSLPLSPPNTDLRGRPHPKTLSSSASALGLHARRPSRGADQNPPEYRLGALHSSSAHEAPPLIEISSSEDERRKLAPPIVVTV